MSKVYQGQITAKNKKFAIIIGRFNEFISSKLMEGAVDCIVRHEGDKEKIDIFWVPGSFEIPATAQLVASKKAYDGILCLGAVIRGATPHFDHISAEVTKGIAQVSMMAGVPVIYGVLTTDTIEQAIERAGTKSGNKGWETASAMLDMVSLFEQIKAKK